MFWKKKRQQKNNYNNIIGLDNTQEIIFSNTGEFLLPVTRSVLCLLLTIGSICGYASCFGAQFNLNTIFVILLICSTIISFVRSLRSIFIKNTCYIGFLFIFIFLILKYYRYVNSGYHAIINITYASLENYLGIPALVHYEELIENSYITITYFLIFFGIFELLLYHMWIGERINLLTVFLISCGPYIIPLFINMMPDNFYLICLLTAYISIIIIRFSLHINTHPEKNKSYSVYRKFNPWSHKTKGFSYGANGIAYFTSLFVSLIISLCILITVNIIVPYSSFQKNTTESTLKASVKDEVKYIVTFGLSGYFNKYYSTGGLNDGKLGGIHSVRPDYETDLIVRFVPLSGQPLYLRGFIGIKYTNRQWYNTDILLSAQMINENFYKTLCDDAILLDEYNSLSRLYSKRSPYRMDITNIGANVKYSYSPYYTNPEALERYPFFAETPYFLLLNHSKTYYYYLYSGNTNKDVDLQENEEIISTYLQVPSSTRNEILKFLTDNDLCTDYITESSGTYANLSGSELQTVINRISDCLSANFVYSLNPGITPDKKDFVGYFLNENKKGFCAHFASSAVLIFRTLGIPARYVEGYVITSEDLYDGEIVEDVDISSYIDTSMVDVNLSVVDVEIADDKAHAWVEYYDPDFGWKVFEATTASMDASSNFDFWSSLYNMFNHTADTDDDIVENNTFFSSSSLSSVISRILLFALGLTVLFILMYWMYHFIRQYRSYHRVRKNINVRNYYKIICRKINKTHPEFDYLITFNEQLDYISSHYKLSHCFQKNTLEKLSVLLEQAAFSHAEITYSEYQYSMKLLKILRRNIYFHF